MQKAPLQQHPLASAPNIGSLMLFFHIWDLCARPYVPWMETSAKFNLHVLSCGYNFVWCRNKNLWNLSRLHAADSDQHYLLLSNQSIPTTMINEDNWKLQLFYIFLYGKKKVPVNYNSLDIRILYPATNGHSDARYSSKLGEQGV